MKTAHHETLRRRVYLVLEGGHAGGVLGGIVEAFLIVLILLNVIGFTLQSVPEIRHLYWFDLTALEIVSVAIFSVEYALRLWVSVEDPIMAELGPWRGRLRAAAKPQRMQKSLGVDEVKLQLGQVVTRVRSRRRRL